MGLGIRENLDEFTIEEKDDAKLKYLKEEMDKKKIISELEIINRNENNEKPIHRKYSDDNNLKLNNSFDSINLTLTDDFLKHISNFCTVYHDFNAHSEEYFSYIV